MTTSTRTILVIEDNPITRKRLRVTLETEGYAVIDVADGRAALAAAQEAMPGLILQDLVLPDMSGFELVRELRQLPGGAETPILALSGFISRLEDARTAEAGFTAMLVKPVEPSRLVEVVKPYFPGSGPTSIPPVGGRRLLLVDDDPSGRVVTEVEDTGSGIRPEVLKRLFTPFFTTKPRGVGTGLGLSICQRIVSDLGGEITVESAMGRGATFRTRTRGRDHDQRQGSSRSDCRCRAVRRDLVRFDDVMTGAHFYEQLLAQSPALAARIVFLTGGVFTPETREFLDRVPNARLEKPFESQTLKALVNERLRRPPD